jgi:hypothetical protein
LPLERSRIGHTYVCVRICLYVCVHVCSYACVCVCVRVCWTHPRSSRPPPRPPYHQNSCRLSPPNACLGTGGY